MTDANGNVQAEYDYDPYGRQNQLSGTMNADFGFTGLYVHQPSGLNLALYRGYSAALARWISRDPSGTRGGINLYNYVRNRTLTLIDMLGLDPCCVFQRWNTTVVKNWWRDYRTADAVCTCTQCNGRLKVALVQGIYQQWRPIPIGPGVLGPTIYISPMNPIQIRRSVLS